MNRRRFLELMLGGAALATTKGVTAIAPKPLYEVTIGTWEGVIFRCVTRTEPLSLSAISKALDVAREHNVGPDVNGDYWMVTSPRLNMKDIEAVVTRLFEDEEV